MLIKFLSLLESSLFLLVLNAIELTIKDTGRFGYSDDTEI
jgi:hypothetical protein